MALEKLVDALNEFRAEYAKALATSLQGGSTEGDGRGKGHVASGKLLSSLEVDVQPKVRLFGQIYRMQVTMEDYGETLDEGRPAGVDTPTVSGIMKWLTYPNVLARVTKNGKQLSDYARERFATNIVNKIAREGVTAKNWIQPAYDKVTPQVEKVVEAALLEDLEITFDQIKQIIERK